MTPKEKAKELLWKYLPILEGWKQEYSNQAKQCALIAVDEIINCDYFFKTLEDTKKFTKYWVEVQNEIQEL